MNITDQDIIGYINQGRGMLYNRFKSFPNVQEMMDDVPYVIAISIPKFDHANFSDMRAYLLRCVWNSAYDVMRRYKARNNSEATWVTQHGWETGKTDDTDIFADYAKLRVREELSAMDDEVGDAIRRIYVDGDQPSIVANRSGVSRSMITIRRRKGIDILRKRILKPRRRSAS